MKYLSVILLFGALLYSSTSYAGWSHGGDIKWERLGNDSFLFTLSVYRDCNGINVSYTSLSLESSCGSFRITLASQSSRDITPICNDISSRCANRTSSFQYGVQEVVRSSIVDLSTLRKNGCCKVNISWSGNSRSSDISTGAKNNKFYHHAEMGICGSPVNVNWLREPRMFACAGKDFSTESFSISTDSTLVDSVVYSWAEPLQSKTTRTTWASPYSYDKPLSFLGFPYERLKFPRGLHLDSISGHLLMRPMKPEITILKIKATIYRRGVWQGSVYRDQVLIVHKCPNNDYPVLSSFDCQAGLSIDPTPSEYQKIICGGDSLSFTICASDNNKLDSVTLSYEHSVPGLSITIDKSTPTREKAIVSWKTSTADIRDEPYVLTIRANDHACPVIGEDFQRYELLVRPPASFKIDVDDLSCGNYQFTATEQDSNLIIGSEWRIDDKPISSKKRRHTDTAWNVFNTPGQHNLYFKASLEGLCDYKYEDSVFVDSNFLRVKVGLDTVLGCENDSVTLSTRSFLPQGPLTFRWTNEYGLLLSTAPEPRIKMPDSLHSIFVKVKDGTCKAIDDVILQPYESPKLNLPERKYACAKDSAHILLVPTNKGYHDSILSIQWTDSLGAMVLSDSAALVTRIPGQYLLSIKTPNCEIMDTVSVRFLTPKFELIGDTLACQNDVSTYSGSSKHQGNFEWFVGGSNLKNPRFSGLGKDLFFVATISEKIRLRFTAAAHGLSCPSVRSLDLVVQPLPNFNVSHASELCQGDSVLLTANDTTIWYLPEGAKSAKSLWYKAKKVNDNNRPYVTVMSTTSKLGCSNDTTIEIYHNKKPVPDFSVPDSVLKNEAFFPTNNDSFEANHDYEWQVGNPVFTSFKGYEPFLRIDSVGTFELSLHISNSITGCSGSTISTIKVVDTRSIGKVPLVQNIRVYPNPANDRIHLHWPDEAGFEVGLMDLQGRKLLQTTAVGDHLTLSTKSLETGTYLLLFQSQDHYVVRKLEVVQGN